MEYNLADLFECVADAVPDRLALVGGERHLTYAQLDRRANRVGHLLLDIGVRPGQHVGIHAHNRTEWVEIMLGCLKARVVPINVNYRYVAFELRYLFDNADLAGLFFEGALADRVAEAGAGLELLRHLVVLDAPTGAAPTGAAPPPAVLYETALACALPTRGFAPRSPDDLYVLYTGGTTGLPKGVLWRQEDIFFGAMGGGKIGGPAISRPERIVDAISPAPPVMLALGPLVHGNAQWTTFVTLFMGGTVVLYTGARFDASAVWDVVEHERVTTISLVGDAMARPLMDGLVLREPPAALVALVSGGALLSPAVKAEIQERLPDVLVLDSFGATETGAHGAAIAGGAGTGPRFRMDGHTAVMSDALRPVAPGEVGMLARCGHVPLGYYKDADRTAATFVEVDGVRWAVAGDRARRETDGTITVLGRGSQSINTGGEKVYPEEVEAVLKAHPLVFDAVVVGLTDARWGERVSAVVQPRDGTTLTLEDLLEHCRPLLAGYKVPRALCLVERVERTAAGKPDYRWAAEVAARGCAGSQIC